jgi:hypothetical protein
MESITSYSEKIDLCTEHGRKIYDACTKGLSVIFDGKARKHLSLLTSFTNIADKRSW